MYSPSIGRFLTRDTWQGDYNRPMSLNKWNYVEGNPVNRTDPSGMCFYTIPGTDTRVWLPDGATPCNTSQNIIATNTSTPILVQPDCSRDLSYDKWKKLGIFNLSSYYIANETQYYPYSGSSSRPVPSLGNQSFNKYFLFSREGVCMQGTGKTKNEQYIHCTAHMNWLETPETPSYGDSTWVYHMPPDKPDERENKPFSFWSGLPTFVTPLETVAICSQLSISHNGSVEIRIKSSRFINIFYEYKQFAQHHDNIFTVTDTGGKLCERNAIDIYLGEQPDYKADPSNSFVNFASKIQDIDSASVEWRYKGIGER
jgi:hypothetical protein